MPGGMMPGGARCMGMGGMPGGEHDARRNAR